MKKNVKISIIAVIVILALGVVGIKTFAGKNTATSESTTTSKEATSNKDVTTNENTATSEKTSTNGTEVVKNIPMLIDLGAGTCIPCKQMVPVLEEVKKVYDGKAVVKVIDVYDSPDEANKYGIKVIPTQIFLDKDGKEFFRHEGFFSKEEISEVFNQMGVK